jgi:hypothetical protein
MQSDRQHLADADARDDLATRAWDAGPDRSVLARLDFRAVLVIYRAPARLSRCQLGHRTALPGSTISYWEAGKRHGLYDVRHLLQFADLVKVSRPALPPVILGQPHATSAPAADQAAAPWTGGADRE